jgi:hypothetical protein
VDTLTAIELVLPNGNVVKVTEKDKDLWFALKVGLTIMQKPEKSSDLTVISSTGRTEQLCEFDQESRTLVNNHIVSIRESPPSLH